MNQLMMKFRSWNLHSHRRHHYHPATGEHTHTHSIYNYSRKHLLYYITVQLTSMYYFHFSYFHSTPPTLTDTASLPSPTGGGVVIKCPICMESAATFKQRGSQVAVTTCGHVFCDLCIRRAIAEQRRCPTCRKKLTVRQIHPLYLPL